ncbi:MAG: hypothetical protein S4CHLAM45_10350 [Chlamydiales bacterium]|nr:hypothetical protein [Chlamydiales bacterium]MCH9619529.1 hypothetical protein [Chlamydiales bacterium]MCH9623135.1 hypothetical protein [Chlamydiales bacterium]
MQTLACNSKGKIVRADHALRGETYTCFECQRPLLLRAGRRRRPHFYHKKAAPCRFRMRSTFHLRIQNFLQEQLVSEKTFLEHPFPSVRRIADFVWPAKRWIFEVQCSPISDYEVQKRMEDYQKMGYQVIWILYDRQFKKFHISEAELFLQGHPYFFISPDLFLYEQRFKISSFKRVAHSNRHPISLKTLDLTSQKKWIFSPTTQKKESRPFFPLLRWLEKFCK